MSLNSKQTLPFGHRPGKNVAKHHCPNVAVPVCKVCARHMLHNHNDQQLLVNIQKITVKLSTFQFVYRKCAVCLPFPCSCCCWAPHVHLRRHSRLPAHLLWSACHGPCDRHVAGSQAPGGWPLFTLLLLSLHDCSWGTACGGRRVPYPGRRSAAQHILYAQADAALSMLLFTSNFALSLQKGLVMNVICCCSTYTTYVVTDGQPPLRHLLL